MGWLTLASGLAKVLSAVLKILERKQLMDAGKAKAQRASLEGTLVSIRRVQRARRDPAVRERMRARLRGTADE